MKMNTGKRAFSSKRPKSATDKVQKLTQAELAECANLSVPYISHIENGIKQSSLQAVVNIAEALGCTADKLLYESWQDCRMDWHPELAELRSDPPGWRRTRRRWRCSSCLPTHRNTTLMNI